MLHMYVRAEVVWSTSRNPTRQPSTLLSCDWRKECSQSRALFATGNFESPGFDILALMARKPCWSLRSHVSYFILTMRQCAIETT